MRPSVLALWFVCIAACTGTDVGNPPRGGLTTFDTPGCKTSETASKGIEPAARAWLPDQASYSGLQCFLWDPLDDGKLRIRVTNYGAGCHSNEGWEPRAIKRGAGEIDLLLESPECLAASCGWCIYDLLFELEAEATRTEELTLNLLQDPDCSDQPRRDQVKIPLAARPAGTICDYANPYAISEWALTHGQGGAERMPCGIPEAATCDAGLSCTAVESAGKYQTLQLCLMPCTSNAECGPHELMTCQQGTCRLAEPR